MPAAAAAAAAAAPAPAAADAAAALAAAADAAAALTAALAAAALTTPTQWLHCKHSAELSTFCCDGRRHVHPRRLHGQPIRRLQPIRNVR